MYKCMKCKKIITKVEDKVSCPYCGYRIFVKMRPTVSKKVRSR